MADLIVANKIPGAAVYGVEQVSYTVDGVSGNDYAAALSAASFRESVAIEQALSAYAEVVRQRERKLEDLGQVMSYLNEAAAKLKVKEQTSDDTTGLENGAWVTETARKYGISISCTVVGGVYIMTRKSVYNAQNAVQYATDREDNELKQDLVSLNSYISKRDNSYSTAAKLVRKVTNAVDSTIRNI